MKPIQRVFLIVPDSLGIGEAPDAADFGDSGANTLLRLTTSEQLHIPTLRTLGIGAIEGMHALSVSAPPTAAYARLTEQSRGKDTTLGHWELAGHISRTPLPTYPNGFPQNVIEAFSRATGRGILCNRPASGTAVIAEYGDRHCQSGDLIVYTSADSVFQIAAHEDVVPPETLYAYCRIARDLLHGEHGVGRVIARPFIGKDGKYTRTANRHDFSLEPPTKLLPQAVKEAGLDSIGIGKIHDIFAGVGLTDYVYTQSNADGCDKIESYLQQDFHGLCFVNLVDFDSAYGHRQDVDGYAAALSAFDKWLATHLSQLRHDDVLMIAADHGCDPGDSHTDHTREYTPWLIYGERVCPCNLGTRATFADVAATIADLLAIPFVCDGVSAKDAFLKEE